MGIRRFKPQNAFEIKSRGECSFSSVHSSEYLLKLVKNNGIKEVPLDLNEILKLLKVSLIYKSYEAPGTSGGLSYDSQRNIWIISVNRDHHPRRQRFTIAHEIGHYCLHKDRLNTFDDTIFFRNDTKDHMEWQANQFAAEILMPEDYVIKFWNEGCKTEGSLAMKFDVSVLAIRFRLRQLNL